MKKVGSFFFALVPFFLVLVVQLLVSCFMMGISFMTEFTWYTATGSDTYYTIADNLQNLWSTTRFNTYLMVIYAVMTIAIFGLWYYIKYDGCYLPKLQTTFHPISLVGILMLVPGMQYLSTYIVSLTATLFPDWLKIYEELLETAGLDGSSLTFGMFLYSVILAPFSEELIFRGVTMRQAKKALPFWAANLMQAILFGVFHMNMIQGIYAFCLGLILGYVCEKGGSIYYSILLHMLFNFWGAVLSQFLTIGESTFSVLFWFFFAIIMTIGGLFVFRFGLGKRQITSQVAATYQYQ